MTEEVKEQFEFEGCSAVVYQGNGKVVLWVEHSKPMSLIILAGFIHMLGEPTGYCTEENDGGFIFAFNKRPTDLVKQWHEVFNNVPTTIWNGKESFN